MLIAYIDEVGEAGVPAWGPGLSVLEADSVGGVALRHCTGWGELVVKAVMAQVRGVRLRCGALLRAPACQMLLVDRNGASG